MVLFTRKVHRKLGGNFTFLVLTGADRPRRPRQPDLQVTIEQTFEALLKLVQALDREESRAIREGLDEESLAVFDLLKKPDLGASDLRRIKKVAVDPLDTLMKPPHCGGRVQSSRGRAPRLTPSRPGPIRRTSRPESRVCIR